MGVIYEVIKLPEKDKKKFLEGIINQEAFKKFNPEKIKSPKAGAGK
ncbi:hypothetical protein [Caproicibacter fermentans]|uniref:Uncharacterized protein n=1 Tax=Caproicibacter fermentans TaxID=2576756 RepID=A0A7G8TE33_9FIRM|nr:hypothetical protein [Caproicibacter fermentans]QNK41874.1 hypothetical protein HCR03_06460 [Caproicibacter fermentans]